jgi:nitrogenase iron protein NifH
VGGIILNKRNVVGEEEKVEAFAEEKGIDIIARIPRSDDITRCEDIGKTCVEGAPESEAAQEFIKLAQKLLSEESK